MTRYHVVESVLFSGDSMRLRVDGREYQFALSDISVRLAKATAQERATYEIAPSGYGIYWPLIDEDLSIDGLLGVAHQPMFTGMKKAG